MAGKVTEAIIALRNELFVFDLVEGTACLRKADVSVTTPILRHSGHLSQTDEGVSNVGFGDDSAL